MIIAVRRTDEEEDEQTPKKTKITQQHQQQEVDWISQLPNDILHPILSLLTLKESCITSALSKRWRNVFPSLPHLDFNNVSFCSSSVRDHASWGHEIDIDCWLESVRSILESRHVRVRMCTVRSQYFDEYREEFANIILFLCNNGIEELTIYNMVPEFKEYCRHFTVPSCLYSCQTPTRIELCKCILKVPSKFSGLRLLNALKIEECMVEDGDLQRLILGCPAVERLTLRHCHSLRNLVVDANELAVLDVTTHRPLMVSIVNAPQLESVTVRFRYDDSGMYHLEEDSEGDDTDESEVSRLVRLLESLGNTQNLSLEFRNSYRYLEILRREGVVVPVTLRSLLPKVKKLSLKMEPNTFMVSIVSCLLSSCPNLEDLVIGDKDVSDFPCPEVSLLDYWDQQMPSDCMRNTLSAVTLYLESVYYWMFVIRLVKFLMNNACVLKKLVIECCDQELELSKLMEVLQWEMRLLLPASPNAVVELKTGRERMLIVL